MFALTCLLAAALTASPAPSSTPSLDQTITAAVTKTVNFTRAPGAAVGVSRNGKVIYTRGFEKRNVARDLPVTEDTAFEIGSMTKQFTAAAILQLQEAHKLSIDDRLVKYLPTFPHAKDVTLRNLLNQTSGLPDYLDGLLMSPLISTPPTNAQLQARVKGPLHFTPGTKFEYSNTNYVALGWVVAKVSKMSWEAYIRSHVFAPAHMTHSGFMSDEPHIANFAQPYNHGLDGTGALAPSAPIATGWAGGAGAIVSTLGDILSWDDALANGRIVSPADYTLMSTPPKLPGDAQDEYAMGLIRDTIDGEVRIWHNGGTAGSHSMNACFPERHLCIVAFENEMNGSPERVVTAVLEAMFPEAAAAAAAPVAGEDPAVTARIKAFFQGLQDGTITQSAFTPEARKDFTRQLLAQIHQQLAPLGAPTDVIYRGKQEFARWTQYTYRFKFAKLTLLLNVQIDKATNLVAGAQMQLV